MRRTYARGRGRLYTHEPQGTFRTDFDTSLGEQRERSVVQHNQSHPIASASPQSDRHFELPQVRELRRAGQPPADAQAANFSSSSLLAGEELGSMTTSQPATRTGSGRRDTFQRRWEQVQARFVDRAARRVNVTRANVTED